MISWKVGFEIELLAPAGRTRADLADRVARRWRGRVRRFFHQQAEPSKAPGLPVFENLTLGFEVVDDVGQRLAAFVDDLTLQGDLDRTAAPRAGWYRIVADDARLLRLVERHCDPSAPLEKVLLPLAALFGTAPQIHPSGMMRIVDDRGVSVAIGAPLPGERERPCEIVTAPIENNHEAILEALLEDARTESFNVPIEGATHIHFDADALLSARTLSRLVDALWAHGDGLRHLLGVNPNCVRLGRWPEALPELVRTDLFQSMDWPAAVAALANLGLTKYCDFNLLNIVTNNRAKHTFEVRILPAHLTAAPIVEATALFEALLRWCCDAKSAEESTPATLAHFIQALPMAAEARRLWLERAAFLQLGS